MPVAGMVVELVMTTDIEPAPARVGTASGTSEGSSRSVCGLSGARDGASA